MNKVIVFASNNANKLKEVKEIIEPLGFTIYSLKDLNITSEVDETESSYIGNARLKALDVANKCSYPVLSDDSGLSIDALDGFPGIKSARFMFGNSYDNKNKAIIKMMEGIENRSASFNCAMVYIDKKNNIEKSFFGKEEGFITLDFDENAKNGFGYDPIFFSKSLNMTFGQASEEEKNKVSHRSRALKQVVDYLKSKD